MKTFWVLGKGISANQLMSPTLIPTPAGIPQAQTPSLQRQTSHHSSLAAVVFGMMQQSKRNNLNNTRKYSLNVLFAFWLILKRFMCILFYLRLGSCQKINTIIYKGVCTLRLFILFSMFSFLTFCCIL